eukprot:COSAG01_NODE_6723_length_3527_cov_3.503209_3_plen_488_part_01
MQPENAGRAPSPLLMGPDINSWNTGMLGEAMGGGVAGPSIIASQRTPSPLLVLGLANARGGGLTGTAGGMGAGAVSAASVHATAQAMPPPETSSASAWRTGISIGQQQQRLPPPQQPPQTAEDRGGSAPTDGDAAYVQGLGMDVVGAPRSSLAAVAGAAAAAAAAPLPSELPPPPPPDPHLIMGHPEGAHHPGNPHTTPRKQRTPLPVLGGSQGGATKRRRSGEDDGAGMLCTAAGSFEGELFQVPAEPVMQHGVAAAAGGALGVCPSMAATDAVMAGEAGVHGLGIQQQDEEEDDDADNEMLMNRGPSPSTVEAVQHLVQMDIGGMNDHEDHGGMFLASCSGGASTAAAGVTGGGATTEDILGSMPLGGTDAISRGILSQHGVAHAVGEPSLHSSVDDDGVGAGGGGGGGGQNTLAAAGRQVPPPWSSRPPQPGAPPLRSRSSSYRVGAGQVALAAAAAAAEARPRPRARRSRPREVAAPPPTASPW